MNETFPAALVEAIASEDIQIAAPPALNVETIGPDGYTFTALIDLYPEVKLGQYKGLSAPKRKMPSSPTMTPTRPSSAS